MPVSFILGRAGTGKTRWCLDAIAGELEKVGDARRLLLIVPEQASFQMERAVALRAPRQGFWRAEVLSFSRLARRILDEAGAEPPTLRASARALALRRVAEREPAALRPFGKSARTPGFFKHLERLIEELLSEGVAPEQFLAAAGGVAGAESRRRAEGLAKTYQAYLEWLGPERLDPAQRLAALGGAIERLDWLRDALIWADGFAGFTGQELEALVALARRAGEVFVTMLLDPAAPLVRDARIEPDVLNLFQRTETTFQRLRRRLSDEGVEQREPVLLQPPTAPRFAEAPELACLEHALATPIGAVSILRRREEGLAKHAPEARAAIGETPPADQVRIVECETHRDELRAAAAFIRRKVIESGGRLRFRDFALVARDLEPFAHEVRDVFADFGIPLFVDRRRPLGAHVLARFVPALLEAIAVDFSVQTSLRLLRSGLTPLSRQEAESIDRLVTANEIQGFETWSRRRWPAVRGEDESLDRARLRFVEAIAPLVRLSREEGASGAAWAETIHGSLAALGVPEKLASWIDAAQASNDWETAEVHRMAWDAVCETLEDLHGVLGDRPVATLEAAAIIDSALGDRSVGLAPPTLDQVLVGSIERSRHPDVKYVWVFGVNDGLFPAPPRADTLLSVSEREGLAAAGLSALRPNRDDSYAERMLAYIALTRASRGVTLSYARVSSDGAAAYPSPIVGDVRRGLPDLCVEAPNENDPPGCLADAAAGYLRARQRQRTAPAAWRRYSRLRDELRKDSRCFEAFETLLSGLNYDNLDAPTPGYARKAEQPGDVAWSGSPSELETYLQCPFKHFARYGLTLDAARGPTPSAIELGRLAHEIMAAVTQRAIDSRMSPREIGDGQWLEWFDQAVDERAGDAVHGVTRPQSAFMRLALRTFLRELVLTHAGRWRRGGFEPLAVERKFERGGESPMLDALEIDAGAGRRVRLMGYIDRIDRCRHDGGVDLVVYDYKSSPRSAGASFLTQDRLQLFSYLLAVEQALAGEGAARVAGVFLAPLFPDHKKSENKYYADASEEEQRMYLYRPRGLFDADVARRLDEQLGQTPSPVAAMQLKKDGELYARSDAIPGDELRAYLDLARRTIEYVVTGIADGVIAVSPLIEGKTLACARCDFAAVCRFEMILNRPRVAETTLPRLASGDDESGGAQ